MAEQFDSQVTITIAGTTSNTVLLDANTGNVTLGGNGRDGDVLLNDNNGQRRVHLSGGDQRMEIRDASGDIIAMIGGGANMRLGTNGQGGDIHLYPSSATNIFNNGQDTIHLNGQTGNIRVSSISFPNGSSQSSAAISAITAVVAGSGLSGGGSSGEVELSISNALAQDIVDIVSRIQSLEIAVQQIQNQLSQIG